MKKITALLITFLGICAGYGQKQAVTDTVENRDRGENPSVKLFPNPAKYKVELELTGFEAGYVQLQVYDSRGTLWRNEKRMTVMGMDVIMMMFSLEPGIYLLLIRQNEKMVRKKLIIQ